MGVIYENSPLIELMAEVQWELTPVTVAPGAAVDPFFEVVAADVTRELATAGYPFAMTVVPPGVPRELTPWQARTRFSSTSDEWPKFQVGPGTFTVNMIGKRYRGWSEFRNFIETGIQALSSAYPDPARLFKLRTIKLNYTNAFSDMHGFAPHEDFIARQLHMSPVVPQKVMEKFSLRPSTISTSSVSKFPLPNSQDSSATVQVSDGKLAGKDACIMHIGVEGKPSLTYPMTRPVLEWFDKSHTFCDALFDELLSDELKAVMRPMEG